MTHRVVKFYFYLLTLILSLIIVVSVFLHDTKYRHSFGVPHIIVINSIIVCCEDHDESSRSCINHYKPVSIIGVVYNTILLLYVSRTWAVAYIFGVILYISIIIQMPLFIRCQ